MIIDHRSEPLCRGSLQRLYRQWWRYNGRVRVAQVDTVSGAYRQESVFRRMKLRQWKKGRLAHHAHDVMQLNERSTGYLYMEQHTYLLCTILEEAVPGMDDAFIMWRCVHEAYLIQ